MSIALTHVLFENTYRLHTTLFTVALKFTRQSSRQNLQKRFFFFYNVIRNKYLRMEKISTVFFSTFVFLLFFQNFLSSFLYHLSSYISIFHLHIYSNILNSMERPACQSRYVTNENFKSELVC